MLNNLIAGGFVVLTIMKWNLYFLPGAVFFGYIVQRGIRVLGKRDPQFWRIYMRYRSRPLVREAYGAPGATAPAPRILPKPGLFVH
jgi:type IV secretory pathway TrbD component